MAVLHERAHEVPLSLGNVAYGICFDADSQGQFSYLTGLESKARSDIPLALTAVDVPEGRYAVFNHFGQISDMRKTVYTIWNKALAEEELRVRKAPDFELYDERFDPVAGTGTVEIWIPIA